MTLDQRINARPRMPVELREDARRQYRNALRIYNRLALGGPEHPAFSHGRYLALLRAEGLVYVCQNELNRHADLFIRSRWPHLGISR